MGEIFLDILMQSKNLNRNMHTTSHVFRYGGPGSQEVTEKFSIAWETYLSSTHHFIITYSDGRGSAARGNTWLHSNYKNLGTLEIEDAIQAGE